MSTVAIWIEMLLEGAGKLADKALANDYVYVFGLVALGFLLGVIVGVEVTRA